MKKRSLSVLTALALCLSLLSGAALAAGPEAGGGTVPITTPLNFTDVGSGDGQTPAQGAGYRWSGDAQNGYLLEINGLHMELTQADDDTPAVTIPNDGKVVIQITGENSIAASGASQSIFMPLTAYSGSSPVVVQGGGTLTTTSASGPFMASNDLVIRDVTIHAATTQSGIRSDHGDITVESADITMTSNGYSGPCIWTSHGSMTINNSTLKLTTGDRGIFVRDGDLSVTDSTIDISSTWGNGAIEVGVSKDATGGAGYQPGITPGHKLLLSGSTTVTAVGSSPSGLRGVYVQGILSVASPAKLEAEGANAAIAAFDGIILDGTAVTGPADGVITPPEGDARKYYTVTSSDGAVPTSAQIAPVDLAVSTNGPLLPGESAQATVTAAPSLDQNTPVTIYSGTEEIGSGRLGEAITLDTSKLKSGDNTLTAKLPAEKGNVSKDFILAIVGVTDVVVTPSALTLAEGKGGKLTADIQPSVLGDTPIVWSSSDPAVASVDASGTVTAHKAGTATITASEESGHAGSCAVTVNPVEETPVRPPELPADTDAQRLKVEVETGLSEVPAAFEKIEELNTPAKIEARLKTEIRQVNTAISEDDTAVYDVNLMVSTDNGLTWEKASKENFPAGGLTLTLPYPEGSGSSCRFTVVHMFTTNDFGKQPGATETPPVTNTADGIRFTVTGLSPISVGWTEAAHWDVIPIPVSTYPVEITETFGGTVKADRTSAAAGITVNITVTPDSGYLLEGVTVTDGRGGALEVTDEGGGRYAFKMPAGAVTVEARFTTAGHACPSLAFTDLSTGAWYHEAVDYVLAGGLMGGYGGGRFGPNEQLSRAQLCQILYNREGKPAVSEASPFSDVADGVWYAEAVVWAGAGGIVGGYGDGKFGPDDPLTREQLAVMLYRYARYQGMEAVTLEENLIGFADGDQVSGFAVQAMNWAVGRGIVGGYDDNTLRPGDPATRAQAAQMLKSFIGLIENT